MKYLGNEKGYTFMEVLLAAVVLAILSLPIFYNSLQSANNYVSAEKYYIATLDAENMITQIKATLDSKFESLNGKAIDIESTLSSAIINTKGTSDFEELSGFSTGIAGLNLDTTKYSYQVYIKKLEASVNIASAKNDVDHAKGSYKLKHGLDLAIADIPETKMIVSGANFVPGNNISINNTGFTTYVSGSGSDRLLTLEYVIDSATSVTTPINVSTYDLAATVIDGAHKVKLLVRNYSTNTIHINLFTDLEHCAEYDTLISYDQAGAIYVVTNQDALPIPEHSYAIVVAVTDNKKNNNVLVQLTDVYSYVPK